MTEIIHGENARFEFREAFDRVKAGHFGPGRFRGAMQIPAGMPFHVAPRIPAKPINVLGRIGTSEYMLGRHTKIIEGLLKDLADGCFPTPEDRSVMWIPVFRTRPVLEMAPFDAAGWPIAIWCDMVWAPSRADLGGLEPAWP